MYSKTALLLIIAICVTGCDDLCSNEVIVEKVNNSKTYKLIHFDRIAEQQLETPISYPSSQLMKSWITKKEMFSSPVLPLEVIW